MPRGGKSKKDLQLPDLPTEEQAELILEAAGIEPKEVVNGFINRLLKERSELFAEVEAKNRQILQLRNELADIYRGTDQALLRYAQQRLDTTPH